MRHVSRTHRVALDWLFDRINLDPKIQIRYKDTKHQLADILTKGFFTGVHQRTCRGADGGYLGIAGRGRQSWRRCSLCHRSASANVSWSRWWLSRHRRSWETVLDSMQLVPQWCISERVVEQMVVILASQVVGDNLGGDAACATGVHQRTCRGAGGGYLGIAGRGRQSWRRCSLCRRSASANVSWSRWWFFQPRKVPTSSSRPRLSNSPREPSSRKRSWSRRRSLQSCPSWSPGVWFVCPTPSSQSSTSRRPLGLATTSRCQRLHHPVASDDLPRSASVPFSEFTTTLQRAALTSPSPPTSAQQPRSATCDVSSLDQAMRCCHVLCSGL